MKKRRTFTLLEILIAISILTLAAGAITWKMHRMIIRKNFLSSSNKLRSRLHSCRRLAQNCQADWKGILTRDGEKWIFESICVENPSIQRLPTLKFDSFSIFLEGEKKEFLIFYFTASGDISPKGTLILSQGGIDDEENRLIWKMPEMFHVEEGKELGPLHPSDLKKVHRGS